MNDPRILQFFLPVPKSHASSSKAEVAEDVRDGLSDVPKPKPKPKPKLNPKGKAKFKQPRGVPTALKGLKTRTERGNICWDYNLDDGCQNETRKADGIEQCSKGLHICAGCHKPGHAYPNCRAKKE